MTKPGQGMELGTVTERLPFRVVVATGEDLAAVARLRASAYGRHLPTLGVQLLQPEPADYERGCEVFVARSKLDGMLLGTLRTHINTERPLPLEASIELPDRFRGRRMVEATRLSILGGSNSSNVRNALFKAFYLYCLQHQVDHMVAAGRKPVDRLYDGLLFSDVDEPGVYHPMAHAGGVPHRVMSLATQAAEPLWRQAQHSLYRFMCLTEHPDIELPQPETVDALGRGRRHEARLPPYGLPATPRYAGVAA